MVKYSEYVNFNITKKEVEKAIKKYKYYVLSVSNELPIISENTIDVSLRTYNSGLHGNKLKYQKTKESI